MGCKLKNAAHHPVLEELSCQSSLHPERKPGQRPGWGPLGSGGPGRTRSQITVRYSQEKNFMNLGSYIFPYPQKRQNHLLKCLFLWLAATSYWDACVIARPLFTKITYTLVSTLPLGNSPQRSLRDCLSGYNLQFGWYKNLYFFLWLTIDYFFVDTNKIAYLFSCLLAIWRSSFMKNLFCFLTHFFLLGCLYFLLFQSTCRSSLCILDVNPLSDICTVNVPCLFTLIMVSFEE